MGSQQILLIVIAVVLIGIMILVGLDMFEDQAASTNRDAIANDLTHFAVQVQKFYRTPALFQGGGHSFNGLTSADFAKHTTNSNGTYVLTPDPATSTDTFVEITGTGVNKGNDGSTPVRVQVTVWPDSSYLETLN